MGLAGSLKAQHASGVYMVADWNNCLPLFVLHWERRNRVVKLLLWLVLLFFCWPLALVALVLYPLVWLLLLPFRVVGIAVEGALQLVWAIVTLPARLLRAL
jgi:hypothetical protein